jgi:hypothetical protein
MPAERSALATRAWSSGISRRPRTVSATAGRAKSNAARATWTTSDTTTTALTVAISPTAQPVVGAHQRRHPQNPHSQEGRDVALLDQHQREHGDGRDRRYQQHDRLRGRNPQPGTHRQQDGESDQRDRQVRGQATEDE